MQNRGDLLIVKEPLVRVTAKGDVSTFFKESYRKKSYRTSAKSALQGAKKYIFVGVVCGAAGYLGPRLARDPRLKAQTRYRVGC